jgi:hypothetical protein
MSFLISQTQSGFPINSKVTMHDGTYKKIKDLVIGDKLKSIKISDLILNNNYNNISIDLKNLKVVDTLVTNIFFGNAFVFNKINKKLSLTGNTYIFTNLDSENAIYNGEEDPDYTNYNWGCLENSLISNRNRQFEYLLNDNLQKERITSISEMNNKTRIAIIQTQPESIYFVNGFAVFDRFKPIQDVEGV